MVAPTATEITLVGEHLCVLPLAKILRFAQNDRGYNWLG